MFEETVSIDLGAAYTKVAHRRTIDVNQTGTFKETAKILMVGGEFDKTFRSALIPSLAIRTQDPQHPWYFGWDAALMTPGSDMQVFQNWKADLFRPANDRVSGMAVIIAHRFFVWLKSKLESAGIDLKKCQTRVAMPAFNTFDEKAELIARCMDLSGWDDPTLILKVTEPRANIIGMFAEGQNALMRGQAGLNLNFIQMFGLQNVYIQAARNFFLHGGHGNLLKIMVVDVGAFTTDIASLIFDVTENCDGLHVVQQTSHSLGVINELDKPVFAGLGERHGFSQSQLSFGVCEDLKKSLYNLKKAESVNIKSNGKNFQLNLGSTEDFQFVDDVAKKFAVAVWEKVSAAAAIEFPERVFLTGGGSLILPVASALNEVAAQSGIHIQNVQQDNEAPITDVWRPWKQTGESLQRLATALGGCNVILQASSGMEFRENTGLQPRPPIILNPPTGFKTCRCQGNGNHDCCFCGGRGFVEN